MRKILIISVLFIIYSSNCFSQSLIDDDFKKNVYYGEIKSINTNTYDYYYKDNEVDIKEFEQIKFNRKGKLISTSRYNSEGKKIPFEITYIYDDNDFLISIEKADTENNRLSKTLFINNENGFPTKTILYEDGRYYSEINYEYNSINQCIKETHTKPDWGTTYVINTYDSKNNKINILYKDDTKAVIGNNSYKYNDKNQLIQEIIQYGKLKPSTTLFEYNEFGYIIKHSILDKDDKIRVLFKYEYEYDSKKNWIKQKEIIEGKQLKIRSIEYY